MKKRTKILVLLLSLAIICTGLVIAVSANGSTNAAKIGDTEYATFDEAFTAAKAYTGEGIPVITLLNDVTLSSELSITKSMTIDLNGNKISTSTQFIAMKTANVNFILTGSGTIEVNDNKVINNANVKNANVLVEGTGKGISIIHNGGTHPVTTMNNNANITFRNVDITSTAKLGDNNSNAFFQFYGSSSAEGTLTFEGVEFKANYTDWCSSGKYIITLKNKGKAVIKNSNLYTEVSSAINMHESQVGEGVESVRIENSQITCDADPAVRLYMFFLKNAAAAAEINVYDSVLTCEGRLAMCELDALAKVTLNSYGSTLRVIDTDPDTVSARLSRHMNVRLYNSLTDIYKGSTVISDVEQINHNNNIGAIFAMEAGVRVNKESITEATKLALGIADSSGAVISSSSQNYAWIYDPFTNPEAPYLLINKDKHTFAYDVSDFNAIYPYTDGTFGDRGEEWVLYASGKASDTNNNASDKDGWNSKEIEGKWPNYFINGNTRRQWDIKEGTLSSIQKDGEGYLKYYVTAAEGESTVLMEKDPYMIFGAEICAGPSSYKEHIARIGGDRPKKVVVFSLDFRTDTQYPTFSLSAMARGSDGSNNKINIQQSATIKFNNDGTIVNGLKDAREINLYSSNDWNKVTMVCYTDPADANGEAYFYINGEYVGSTDIYNPEYRDSAYLQGIRVNIVQGATNADGASLCIDNVSAVAYRDYRFAGEKDATAESAGVYYPEKYVTDSNYTYTIAGVPFEGTLTEAVKQASAAGTYVDVTTSLANPLLSVSANGSVNLSGNGVTVLNSSYGFVNNNGFYTFNESYQYDAYVYDNGGYIDPLKDGSYDLENSFKVIQIKLGFAPNPDFRSLWVEESAAKKYTQTGWSESFDGVAIDNGKVYYFPVLDGGSDIKYVVYNASGVKATGVDADAVNDVKALANGDTFKLLGDVTVTTNASKVVENATVNFDLNGYRYDQGAEDNLFNVKGNGTLNVYSSRPGGVVAHSVATNTRLFYSQAASNAHFNFGKYTDASGVTYPGSNLTVETPVLLDLATGDATCTVNIDGVTIASNQGSNGLIITRNFNGSVAVKNATIIHHQGNNIFGIGNNNDDNVLSTKVTVDDSIIIIKSTGAGMFSQGIVDGGARYLGTGDADATITFTNVITNASFGAEHTEANTETYGAHGKVIVGEGCVFAGTLGDVTFAGVEKYNYNAPISISDKHYIIVNDPKAQTTKHQTVYVVEAGYENLADPNVLMLVVPSAAFATAKAEDKVTVNFTDAFGNTVTEYYAPGGNVKAHIFDTANGEKIALEYNGEFNEDLKTGVNAGETYNYAAKYDVTGFDGIKVNLSLYADFGVNLYVPAIYEGFVAFDTDKTAKVTIGGVNYIKVTKSQACSNVSGDVVFAIVVTDTIGDNEFTYNANVEVSIMDYAKAILDGVNAYSDADKVLVYYMLCYANEAANYFCGEYDAAASALIAANDDVKALYTVSEELDVVDEMGISAAISDATIVLYDAPAFAFTVKKGFRGTITVSYASGKAVRVINSFADAAATEDTIVTIDGMKAYNFGTDLIIKIEGEVNGEAVNITNGQYTLDTYVDYASKTEGYEKAANLAKALKAYAEVSEAYKNKTLLVEEA